MMIDPGASKQGVRRQGQIARTRQEQKNIADESVAYVFKVAQQVRDSFAFIVGQCGLIDFSRAATAEASRDMTPTVYCRETGPTRIRYSTHSSRDGRPAGPRGWSCKQLNFKANGRLTGGIEEVRYFAAEACRGR